MLPHLSATSRELLYKASVSASEYATNSLITMAGPRAALAICAPDPGCCVGNLVYVGSITTILDEHRLKELGIDIIISLSECCMANSVHITQHAVNLPTTITPATVGEFTQKVTEVIKIMVAREPGQRILICCIDGINIAPAVIALYLALYLNTPLEGARAMLRSANDARGRRLFTAPDIETYVMTMIHSQALQHEIRSQRKIDYSGHGVS